MIDNSNYMKLVYDLAGSRSKNRFRLEILWGIKKIFEIYEKGEFCVVFDYVCDIEVHTKDELEFYQVKTHNRGEYTLNELIKKNSAGKSILGKLFEIKNRCSEIGEKVKIEIVSNTPLKIDKLTIYSTVEEKEFTTLSDDVKKNISKSLEKESIKVGDFSNSFYRYTTMNLLNPENDIIAEIVNFLEDIKKVTAIKIKPLYRLLYNKVSEKACYEFEGNNYQQIIEKKAMTKKEFDEIINKYIQVTDNSVEKAKNYIDSKYYDNFQKKVNMKKSLSTVVKNLLCDNELKNIEHEIVLYLKENGKIMEQSIENIIEDVYKIFKDKISFLYSEDDKKALIILILHKMEENMYEEDDNK